MDLGRSFRHEAKGNPEVYIPGLFCGAYQGLIILSVGSRREDKIVSLDGRSHGRQILHQARVVGSIEVKIVQAQNRRIVEIHMDDRVVVMGSKKRYRRPQYEKLIGSLCIPGLEYRRKDGKTEMS